MKPNLVMVLRSYGLNGLKKDNRDNRDAEITEKDDSRLRCFPFRLFRLFRLFIPKLSTFPKLTKFPNKAPTALHDLISCQKS